MDVVGWIATRCRCRCRRGRSARRRPLHSRRSAIHEDAEHVVPELVNQMTARILVAGIGNIFLGDDGFGPEVMRHVARRRPDADVHRGRLRNQGHAPRLRPARGVARAGARRRAAQSRRTGHTARLRGRPRNPRPHCGSRGAQHGSGGRVRHPDCARRDRAANHRRRLRSGEHRRGHGPVRSRWPRRCRQPSRRSTTCSPTSPLARRRRRIIGGLNRCVWEFRVRSSGCSTATATSSRSSTSPASTAR